MSSFVSNLKLSASYKKAFTFVVSSIAAMLPLTVDAAPIPHTLRAATQMGYKVELPEGTYQISVSSSNGEVDLHLYNGNGTRASDYLTGASRNGPDVLRGYLSSGTYYIAPRMVECYAWFSQQCSVDLTLTRNGQPYEARIIAYDFWDIQQSAPSSATTVPAHCRQFWYRNANCPSPGSPNWPAEWQ